MIQETELFAMPLSSAQERLWILDRMDPGDPVLNLPASVRLSGRLDLAAVAALRRALAAIVARHEILRTTFEVVDERPVQVIHPELEPALPTVDLAGLPAARRESAAVWVAGEESRQRFDLGSGPLLRAALVRLGEDEHTLLLTLHHIVADGWSIGVLVRELSALYAEAVTGRPADLPELPIQYADFAHWQREQSASGAVDGQLAYWRERLAGLSAGELLPPHRTANAAAGGSASLTQTLPPPLSEDLRALARRERVTLFVTLLAAFKALLHRLSRREDIAVGSPVAGRNRSEVKDLIGLFLNTLVLRTAASASPTFRELLARVRETVTGAMASQDVPFEKLIEELRPERGRTPFFQIFFNMLSFPQGDLQLPGLRVEALAPAESGAKFDLTVYAEDGASGLRLRWVYDAGRYERGRMEEILAQYVLLLQQAVASPDARVPDFSLVTERAVAVLPDPRQPLERAWHGAVHEAFLAQAARRPDRLALSDAGEGGGEWTYGELAAESGRLAHRLIACGVARGDLVAVYGHRSRYLVAAVLGILRSGAAFTILDPAYPPARHVECLSIARPRAWVRIAGAGEPPPSLAEFLAGCGLACEVELGPSGTGDLPSGGAAEPPAVAVGADDLACVAFTSGSTGRPKGVQGRHGPLSHFLPWQCARFDLRENDRYSLLSGLAHDPLQRDIFTPLWCGASVHIPDPGSLAAPGWLAAWMRRCGISVSHLTPAMGRLISETAEPGLRMPSLRRAFFVGDALTWREERQLRRLAPAVNCVNLYGSTETQRAVAYFEIPARPADDGTGERRILPLGRGMQDAQLLLLTPAGGLAGIGEAGEIHVRSPHLARGYAGAPALTAERFVTNPFTGDAGDRAYRTGDLGRYLPDGNVEFLGRVDDQVQIRGFRVEPAEVQTALGLHPAVRLALVLAVGPAEDPGSPLGRRLVAYVVADPERPPAVGELRQFLARSVPDYMVPAAFVFLSELPLQPNGKVDRRALPVPEPAAPAGSSAAPRTQVEEIVAAAWSGLLGAATVGTADDFFELGGHSLLVTQLVARLEKAFGVAVPLRLVFEASRLGEQAARLQELLAGGAAGGAVPPIVPVPRDGDLPLSYAQQRLWFLDRLDPGNPVYNVPAAVRLAGPLQVEALRRSLEEIVRRHEILRARFREVRGEPVQTFPAASPLALPTVDLLAVPEGRRAAEALRLVEAEARTPFDLTRGGLFRAGLLRLAAEEHWVLVSLHHIVSDGWSMGVLVREFLDLYRAFATGRPSPLEELRLQYGDYAAWQQGWLRGEALERQLAYWRAQLAGAPTVLDLPTDLPRSASPGFQGAYEPLDCPEDLYAAVRAFCRREGTTLFMAVLAAFEAALWYHSGREDMVLGANSANRGRTEVEGLIGFFVNMLPLRADLAGNPSLRELLDRVREVTLGAYSHQDVPFDRVVQELRVKREPGRTPLVQTIMDFQTAPPDLPAVPGLTTSPVGEGNELTQFDLSLVVTAGERGLRWSVKYNAGLFAAATVRRLLSHLRLCLSSIVEEPEMRLDALRQRLADADRRELVAARERFNQMRSQLFRPAKPQFDQQQAKEA